MFSVILKENGLLSDYGNRGLATEAAGAVRDFAFGDLGLPRLVSLIHVGSGASRRVAEKVGMHLGAQTEHHGVAYWVYVLDNPTAIHTGPAP